MPYGRVPCLEIRLLSGVERVGARTNRGRAWRVGVTHGDDLALDNPAGRRIST
jgi:hypothetical protein